MLEQLAQIEEKINKSVQEVVENELADTVRELLSENIEKHQFTAWSRGPDGMGVRDIRNYKKHVYQTSDGVMLMVTIDADFQEDAAQNTTLAEAVETGDKRYHMGRPRPFMAPTEKQMLDGDAEKIIASGLRNRGLTVLGG